MQSGTTERMIRVREWRRSREFPKGSLRMVSSGTMYALSSLFIDNSTHIHCAAQVVDLNSQLIIIIILWSFVIYDKTLTMSIIWLQQNHVDWILPSSPLERTQCRQGNMRSTSYYCNMCGDCSTNWNCCLIDVGKTTGPTLQWCACPFDDSFAICSPSQTSLIIDPGSLLHTSQGPRVTVRVFSKDDEVNELGGSEES